MTNLVVGKLVDTTSYAKKIHPKGCNKGGMYKNIPGRV